jgi:hypothetical protein
MSFGLIATLAGLVLGVIGIVPVMLAGSSSLLSLRRARRMLRFSRQAPLDVILTTSDYTQHPSGVSTSFRTNVGEVQGLGSVARALGQHYQGKPMRVHVSADIRNRLDSDVVVLGGPLLNDTARDFMDAFNDKYRANLIHDAAARRLVIGAFSREDYDLKRRDGVPAADLALVLLARNLFTESGSRDVLCAGFTTYGTAAGAELFFNDLLSPRSRKVAKPIRGSVAAAVVANIRMVDKQVTHWEIVYSHVFSRELPVLFYSPFSWPMLRRRLPRLGRVPDSPQASASPSEGRPVTPQGHSDG